MNILKKLLGCERMNEKRQKVLERIKSEVETLDIKKILVIEDFEPYIDLKPWIRMLDEKFGEVEKILKEEGWEFQILINVRFDEDWTCISEEKVGHAEDEDFELLRGIYKHLKVYVPLLIYACVLINNDDEEMMFNNIEINTDS